ncbi:hypothetical protein COW77_00195 [Candidatus Wolfebacteria bacterium CG18_big_fil_WC_8_21_14_2_50_39_7]|uniref:Uncharacterized protein n=4 Tax=Candidatus Wolfeibacteriota TaxID=1752735 RepID=A0A2M7Q692_9BACT|nr:hypothetical protein [Parcubacteria group bacterium]NCO89343.1 hypothetical protein [Candidatus Wolfebacteria bacterium]PIP92379.1 MAG: hypothetical protein COW77_00195 [Candidatus Wolfebacteria bacterium CG18_big_fil_WC_8_21_14_2_50_39_7]PIU98825.1 MAG: hypothetical protein COS60_00990 [Candidatus Wolfebacteria bacterium CG03_land_8_20_14_0_80_39_317]PIY58893.1 MAG: hypothetical protein COY97_01815 [Candidatus Wolfebacteria bacterium CG_4_10_14_0_8_um_filter_39_64]PJB84181.1 MAG: hypotheti
MFKKLKIFLQKIQNSDEATKKRWLIGATAISMILVIGLWLVYIQSTVKSIGNNIENQESTVGFWQIFKNGLVVVFNSVKENIKIIISEITKSRTITVE